MASEGLALVVGRVEIHQLRGQEILAPVAELTEIRDVFNLEIVASLVCDPQVLSGPTDDVSLLE